MKNLNFNELNKALKSNRIKLIFSLLFLLGTIILIYIGYNEQQGKIEVKTSMQEIEGVEKELENREAYIEVAMEPFVFAAYEKDGKEEDLKYYLVMDKDNFLYVIYMNAKDYVKLSKSTVEKPIKISGVTEKIGSNIKELAIKAYNEELGEEYLTIDNFDEYVGPIFLNTTQKIDNSMIYYILSLVSFTIFLGIFLVWLMVELKNRKILKKYSKEELDKIGIEIYSLTNNPYRDMKLYLTKNNLIDISSGIVILKYEDLTWVYPYDYRYNGLIVNKVIKVVTNTKETYEIANTKLLKKDKEKTIDDIMGILKKKNPNIKIGNTKEVKKEVKEKFKQEKEKSRKLKKEEKKHKNKKQK